jgi:hypothetical protein
MGTRKGPVGSKLQGQLQREQINLAMIRSRAGSDDDPNVVAQRERIRAVRAQLSALPDVARPSPVMAATAAPSTAAALPVAAAGVAAWLPTHVVPATGMASWEAPDPSRPPTVTLAGGVQLVVVEQQGAWSRVMGSNGWVGWVDGRLLLALT